MARLGDICHFQSGGTPSKNNASYFGGTIPWITTVALNGSSIGSEVAAEWITLDAIQESAAKIVPANSIMVGTRVGVGKVAINQVPMSTNQDIISLLDIDGTKWDKGFLCKFIQSKHEYLNSQARGATIKGIKIDIISALELPDVGYTQQLHINAILDKVSDLIALRKQQLAKLDELVKARFVELFGDPKDNDFGWNVIPLGKLFSVSSSKRVYQSEQVSDGVPFLRISDLMQRIEEGTETAELYISETHYEDLKENRLVPVPGDILVTSRGTLGRCYEIKEQDKFYFQDGMISWLYDRSAVITNTYIMYLFQMPGFRKQIDEIPAGSTVNYLSLARLKELQVMCPPLELQEQFTTFVKQTDKSKLAIQQGLEKLETLKRALMQQYFG